MSAASDMHQFLDLVGAEKRQQARGLEGARWLACQYLALQHNSRAVDEFRQRFPRSLHVREIEGWHEKAAIGAGGGGSWGGALSSPPVIGDLVALSTPATLIGRIPGVRLVPLHVQVPVATGAPSVAWAGGGRPKPLSAGALELAQLEAATASGIVVVTAALLRFAVPGADVALRDLIVSAMPPFLDQQLVDPSNAGHAADPFVPAAITYGVTPIAASTGDPVEDLRTLGQAFQVEGGDFSKAVILLSSRDAFGLGVRSGATGSPAFSGLTVLGGVLAGAPAIASEALGDQLVMIDGSRLIVADAGEMAVEFSRQAALEMSDAPTQHAGTGTPATLSSMWQTNGVAMRIDRHISWAYHGPIAIVDGVNYLSEGGSPS